MFKKMLVIIVSLVFFASVRFAQSKPTPAVQPKPAQQPAKDTLVQVMFTKKAFEDFYSCLDNLNESHVVIKNVETLFKERARYFTSVADTAGAKK